MRFAGPAHAESEGANSVNRRVIIASYTAIYICVPMPKHWAHVQGWSQVMYETDAGAIPHAHTVNRIDDPPCVTLYVETALVRTPVLRASKLTPSRKC